VTILLVGAAGSVGRRVASVLGADLRVDRQGGAGVEPIDLADASEARALAARLRPGATCVWVAGRVSDAASAEDVAMLVRDNAEAPAAFLVEAAGRLRSFILLSSISVYGTPAALPFGEDLPLAPTTPYGASKAAGELLVSAVGARLGVEVTTVRATQLFDVASAAETVPHRLVAALRAGERPKLSSPATVRDYLHVDDLAQLLAAVARDPRPGALNAGSGRPTRLFDLYRDAYQAAGLEFAATDVVEAAESASQLLDIARAQTLYAFHPTRPVERWVASAVTV
jgi:UDP-glucose 4-epimerase